MLKTLTVSNLAVVERAEVDFAPGLNVITGETGAGKSVLMGALELVLGARADSSVVRDGAKEAEVEATFGEHVVRRTVTAQGRTRAWIDEESVSVAELRAFGEALVDVHGPRANQRLLEESFQREALDAFGGVGRSPAWADYSAAFEAYREVQRQLQELESKTGGADEIDLLTYQIGELEGAALRSDDETIGERHAAAAHAEEILENAQAVTEALGGDRMSVIEILRTLHPRLAALSRHVPIATEWMNDVEDLTIRAEELSRTVARTASQMDAGEESLEELDERLTLVNRLKRKYLPTGAGDEGFVEALKGVLSQKRERLDALSNRTERLAALESQLAAAEKRLAAAGEAVTGLRRAAAGKLARAVTKELRDLGFLRASFSVSLVPTAPTANGCESVSYLFGPNPGESPRALAQIASSGEIARVMLAMKSVLAKHDSVATLVFDEIDANIGGEVGAVVGAKLRAVAKGRQVIAITHLPQSAAYGERHLMVVKRVAEGRTHTEIAEVSGGARAKELARMLGGERSSSVVLRHAEELLRNAAQ